MARREAWLYSRIVSRTALIPGKQYPDLQESRITKKGRIPDAQHPGKARQAAAGAARQHCLSILDRSFPVPLE
jgi:hypothetical protein